MEPYRGLGTVDPSGWVKAAVVSVSLNKNAIKLLLEWNHSIV